MPEPDIAIECGQSVEIDPRKHYGRIVVKPGGALMGVPRGQQFTKIDELHILDGSDSEAKTFVGGAKPPDADR